MNTWTQVISRSLKDMRPDQVGRIGLAFALETLHLVQLEKHPDGEIALRARAAVPYQEGRERLLSSPKTLKSVVRRALRSGRFYGSTVVTVLPPSDVKIVPVTYQIGADQTDGDAILKVMGSRAGGDLSEYVIDYMPVRTSTGEEERLAMVALAKRDVVINYLESLRRSGLRVGALEVGPAAIRRLVSTITKSPHPENVLVVNCGRSLSYLTMLSGGRLLFEQEVEFGEDGLLEDIARALELSVDLAKELGQRHGLGQTSAETTLMGSMASEVSETLLEIVKPRFIRLADEINRSLIYAASQTRGESVKRVFLLGSMARWRGADRLLNALVKIPVEVLVPLSAFASQGSNDSPPDNTEASETAVATGLALRGMVSYG